MKIGELLNKQFSISFEFFPPKTEEGERELFINLKNLEDIKPAFVSVTYGAGGGTREKTHKIVTRIAGEERLNVMAHIACIGHTKTEAMTILESYRSNEIENILALRGDSPAGSLINPDEGELPHAVNLIRLIRENHENNFSIGGAAFPERHPESPNWEWEMKYFKMKADAGLDFAITQLFFENRYYYELLDRCSKYQINIPVIPGIMPITNFKQIQKFALLCSATIPSSLTEKLERLDGDSTGVINTGVEYAVKQCEDLLDNNIPGLHFYTLNKSSATMRIYDAISSIVPKKPYQRI